MAAKTIPVILTDADWQKQKGVIAKMAGETGIGAAMKALKAEWGKVNWNDLDPDAASYKAGGKMTPEIVDRLMQEAKSEYAKVEAVRSKLKALRDLAKTTEAKFKANKLIPSSSRVHVAKIATTADQLYIELKSIDREWADFRKKVAEKAREAEKFTADNLIKATKGACDRALKFVEKVKAAPTVATFNAGMPKAARDITQQIGNVDKLKKQGYDIGKAQPTALFNTLAEWGDKGRKLPTSADEAAVLREVDEFERAVREVVRWAA